MKSFLDLFHPLPHFFELQEVVLRDLDNLGPVHVNSRAEARDEMPWGQQRELPRI